MATPKKPTQQEAENNKRRQEYLRTHGYPNVKVDGSWGPWQQSLWDKATTKEKQYDTSVAGFLTQAWDKLTGNTTYKVEHPEGEIRQGKVDSGKGYGKAAGALALTASRANPTTLLYAIPGAIASSLILGNGPEIMRAVDGAGQSAKQYVQDIFNWGNNGSAVASQNSRFVPLDGTRVMSATAATPADTTGTATPPAPTTNPADTTRTAPAGNPGGGRNGDDNNDSIPKKGFMRRIFEWEKKPGSQSKIGRKTRNAARAGLIYLPAGTAGLAGLTDVGLNIYAASQEPDSVSHKWVWPATKTRFIPERGILKLASERYITRPDAVATTTPTVQTQAQEVQQGTSQQATPSDTVVLEQYSGTPIPKSYTDSIRAERLRNWGK